MKILVFGNSYAADWTPKHPERKAWINSLSEIYDLVNLAECGVSEYKILKQLENVNFNDFDCIILSNMQTLRLHTKNHPLWSNDILMKNADLMYSDIEYHSKKLKNITNKSLHCAKDFFFYHYDDEYETFVKDLIYEKIKQKIQNIPTIYLSDFLTDDFRKKYRGRINHLTIEGNKLLLNYILQFLESLNGKTTRN